MVKATAELSVGLTHQLVNLVWQQCPVDGCDFQDPTIVSSADVLQEGVTALFVKRQQGWLVDFKGAANNVDECFTLDSELTNFIDDQDFAFVSGEFNCRNCNFLERFDVDTIAEDSES